MALVVDLVVALAVLFVVILVAGSIGSLGTVELSVLLGITLAVLLVRHWRRP
jgi:hypothetical protein